MTRAATHFVVLLLASLVIYFSSLHTIFFNFSELPHGRIICFISITPSTNRRVRVFLPSACTLYLQELMSSPRQGQLGHFSCFTSGILVQQYIYIKYVTYFASWAESRHPGAGNLSSWTDLSVQISTNKETSAFSFSFYTTLE